ncbi:MAG: hypothetical protein IJR18_07595 [Campylobacter sp.]|nr:hypothetical protein [Campylobacter sp.]
MDEIFASSKIMAAFLFGTASVAFATIPFLIVLIAGLRSVKQSNSGGLSLVGTLASAYFVHICACLFFMTAIILLDQFSFEGSKYYSETIFGIFWADGADAVFSAAGASEKTPEILGAYATLHMAQIVTKYLLVSTATAIMITGVAYGAYIGQKDTYKQTGYISMALFMVVSTICFSALWVAWAKIASFAMFFPQGSDMVAYLQNLFRQMVLKN